MAMKLCVNPTLSLSNIGKGGNFKILREGFRRYKRIIFKYPSRVSNFKNLRRVRFIHDISKLKIIVNSDSDELKLGVDESYTLLIAKNVTKSIVWETIIEANTVYGALRGLETFSQLCVIDYTTKSVHVSKAPWYIKDKPRFAYRGLLLDISRHYLPVNTIKSIIESMSYAKLVRSLTSCYFLSVRISFVPLEVTTYPKLWNAAYSKWERYTVEDASGIVRSPCNGRTRSPGSCKVMLFHLGGDEVNTDCWNNTPHVKQWLSDHKMKPKDAYPYFVLKAQEIAISKNWTPVNWEETFDAFAWRLNPRTVVHNWLGPGVCPKVVAKGFRCIFSNQGAISTI